ncbi:MAG: DsrE family protein [Gammaproteobacteria bacterium]|nr:DsrE family protein [Gammaproteobacteria bacterium]MDX1455888.1 DsrE family protein [Gammaproteobacteria bacterium]
MTEANKEYDMIVVMTQGANDEVSSVGLTLANGAMTAGMNVGLFLTSNAIDLVRKNALEHTHVQPMEPLKDLMHAFIDRGGDVWACPPCTNSRGYDEGSLIDGVIIHGASVIFERIKKGANTLCF